MTTTTKPLEVVLKTDSRGRVRTPAARREQLLDEFERSGLRGVKFAALTGLKYQTRASWVQPRRRLQGSSSKAAAKREAQVRWLEAVVAETQPAATAGVKIVARRFFGVSSEALHPAQLQLLLALPELAAQPVENVPTPTVVEPRKPAVRKERAPRLPEHLPVVEEVIDPEPVKAQPEPAIVERLEQVFLGLKAGGKHLPQSPLGTALDYALASAPHCKCS